MVSAADLERAVAATDKAAKEARELATTNVAMASSLQLAKDQVGESLGLWRKCNVLRVNNEVLGGWRWSSASPCDPLLVLDSCKQVAQLRNSLQEALFKLAGAEQAATSARLISDDAVSKVTPDVHSGYFVKITDRPS